MRRLLVGCFSLLVVGGLLLGTVTVALAAVGPFRPGSPAFALQVAVEEAGLRWMPSPQARADYALRLLERRVGDVQAALGTQQELVTLPYLNYALDQALLALAEVPPEQSAALWARMSQVAAQARQTISALQVTRQMYPEVVRGLEDKLDTLLTVTQQAPDAQALPRVIGIAVPFPTQVAGLVQQFAELGQQAGTADGAVAPRAVPFPAGSLGAMHAFFPLIGQHATLACEQCHVNGQYIGTPNTCEGCHSQDKPANHFSGSCANCHMPTSWQDVTFDHAAAGATDCISCHTKDKPANHFAGQCSLCHNTTAWTPASFNHQAAGATDCISCHTKDKPANHFAGQCSLCHNTTAWTPASFNHQAAGATDCISCHTKDKPANHFAGQCSLCHNTTAWTPASFNHQAAGATDCISCHMKDKPANHFAGQCSLCHNTTAWTPASFNHQAAGATDCISCHLKDRPPNHFQGQCSQCHDTVAWGNASVDHSFFPITHGGANGVCSTCHPSGYTTYTCYQCHDQAKMELKHAKEGIFNIVGRCVTCHAGGDDGEGGGDDDHGGGDDDD